MTVVKLFRRPNPYMTQQLLANYIVTSLNANGDAFIYKNRNARGQVVELVPLMPHLVEAKGNENELITHYQYQPQGGVQGEDSVKIPKADMVHLRQNVDPNNMRRGLAPLRGVLREIAGDEAAGQYTAALLHNMAVPGVILSPRDDLWVAQLEKKQKLLLICISKSLVVRTEVLLWSCPVL